MRFLYTSLWLILIPFVFLRLFLLSFRNPDYRKRWSERLGFVILPDNRPTICLHAVSVGESQAAVPLVKRLLKDYPQYQILMTTGTPTGAVNVARNFAQSVVHRYLPYDIPFCIKLFLKRTKPALLIVVETELWPNLLHACHEAAIPVLLINARMSERSAKRYAWFTGLTKSMLQNISRIAAQTQADAQRLVELGAPRERISVSGSMKFDINLEKIQGQDNKKLELAGRPVWIAASTHAGEESIIAKAHQQVMQIFPDCLLILAPRHPERGRAIAQELEQQGFMVRSRTQHASCGSDCQIYILDTLGELLDFYAMAQLAFVGGSLVEVGGHNMLEPAALALPVLIGPHYFNFQAIGDELQDVGAAFLVSREDLGSQVILLLQDPDKARAVGACGREFVSVNQGCTERVAEIVANILA